MVDSTPASRADINLPHAQTIVDRIARWMGRQHSPAADTTAAPKLLSDLDRLLRPYPFDPPWTEAVKVADQAATLARELVDEIVKTGYRDDRLGQCVRNLFECLGLAAEGAEVSLLCGERPDSLMRP